MNKILAGAVLASCVVASPAVAQSITGSLAFGAPNPFNQFSPPTATVGPGIEFSYSDRSNTDTADFTPNSLTITDVTAPGQTAQTFYMTFTSDAAGFFDNASFATNTFGGTFTVDGDTLTFVAPTTFDSGTRTAVINFAAITDTVPEPATWAMMILGFGVVGAAMRRRRKVNMAVSYA